MKPINILYLHSHDTGRCISPYGHAASTPNLQRLAEQGVMFRNAYCAAPVCAASRAALLTGQWAHQTGMLGLAHRGWRLNDYRQHIVHTLRVAGDKVVLAGVQHVASWDDRVPPPKVIGYDQAMIVDDDQRGEAVAEFLSEHKAAPFFLDVGFERTHRPFPPASECDAMAPAFLPDLPEIRADMAAFNTSARALDRQYGIVLDALQKSGLAERTLVICTTDHGIAFPLAKCTLTDAGIGVLLIMRGPGGFSGGKVIDELVSHVDVFPTICQLLEIDPPKWLAGASMLPLLRGEETRDEIFAEVNFHAAYEPQRCVRTKRYKYIRRFDDRRHPVLPNCDDSPSKTALLEAGWRDWPRPTEMLFDVDRDPNEKMNLIDQPAMVSIVDDLRHRLDRWMHQTNDPLLDGPLVPPAGAKLNDPDGLSPSEPTRTIGDQGPGRTRADAGGP